MKNLIQSGAITEIKSAQNVAYVLNDERLFLLTGYKVLKSQTQNGFVRCAKLLYNGHIKLTYFTSGLKSIERMLPSLDGDMFLCIVTNLLRIIFETKNNGFLLCQNLDLSFDKVYINPSNLEVRLVYVPLNVQEGDFAAFEKNLRSILIDVITSTPSLKSEHVDRAFAELSNPSVSLYELYTLLCSICNRSDAAQILRASPNDRSSSNTAQPELVFSAMNAPVELEFRINKPEFLIGKNASSVDGVIHFNKAISRLHCKIIYQNGAYFIVDLGSANGTFVNKSRIVSQQMNPIKNGDVVRLANSDFSIQL